MPNYIQPNSGNPVLDSRVSVQVESNKNVLNITGPQTLFSQPGVSARALLVDQLKGTYMGNSKNGPFG